MKTRSSHDWIACIAWDRPKVFPLRRREIVDDFLVPPLMNGEAPAV